MTYEKSETTWGDESLLDKTTLFQQKKREMSESFIQRAGTGGGVGAPP